MVKKKLLVCMTLFILSCPFQRVLAEEENFGEGSLIIPMDSFYQTNVDGGLFEAYGLVYYLLKHVDSDGVHDIAVYWVIDETKTAIDEDDLVIEDLSLADGQAVVELYNHAGGSTALTFNTDDGDHNKRISYSGSLFVVKQEDAATAKSVINDSSWVAVEVHEAKVGFAAPVFKKMQGTPPKIALLNSDEDKTKGNAKILESYLRLAGLGPENYEVVTPYEVAGIAPDGSEMPSVLRTRGYQFLWAPHWDGYKDPYDEDFDNDGNADVEEVVSEIQFFLRSGKALFAECASIETFEHSANGRFLSTESFGHNGGSNDAARVIYNDVIAPYAQIDDLTFNPTGGHLHNWRPYQIGDDYDYDTAPTVNSAYRDTVTRFTIDDTNHNKAAGDTDWDYFVGGNAYGNANYGYVVYLGGHSYADCKNSLEVDIDSSIRPVKFEFDKDITTEDITLLVESPSQGVVVAPPRLPSASTTSPTFREIPLTQLYHKIGKKREKWANF